MCIIKMKPKIAIINHHKASYYLDETTGSCRCGVSVREISGVQTLYPNSLFFLPGFMTTELPEGFADASLKQLLEGLTLGSW